MSVDFLPASKHAKVNGPKHVLAAAVYSFGGFKRMLRETAFRHEMIAGLGILGVFALADAQPIHYLVQIVLMLLLFAVEALNTAIELIVDRISPEFSIFAKRAKDLGSFSVFCLLSTNAIFAGFVLFSGV